MADTQESTKAAIAEMMTPRVRRDCAFGRRDLVLGWEFGTCRRNVGERDLVSGRIIRVTEFCSLERKDFKFIDVCGPEGRYFERRARRWWQFWRRA